MGARFEPNANFLDEIKAEPFVKKVVTDRASDALPVAKANTAEVSQSEAASLSVDETRLLSTSSFFHLIEFGSANNPPRAPMRSAADQFGTYVDTGRA